MSSFSIVQDTGLELRRRILAAREAAPDTDFGLNGNISIASGGAERRPQFGIEDVAAGRTERFATHERAAESLARSVQRIVSGPPGDKARS